MKMLRFLFCIFLGFVGTGCDTRSKPRTNLAPHDNMDQSTNELLERLPNLAPLHPNSCSFKQSSATLKSDLPSPSDTIVMMTGWIQLDVSRFDTLKASDDWQVLDSSSIPIGMKDRLPEGRAFFSGKWNRSFNSNPTMAHGVLLLYEKGEEGRVWFFAQDLDHPISPLLTIKP